MATTSCADFRIISKCPSGSKKNSSSYEYSGGITRHRFTLGEVLSWNIELDITVGNGSTRITLKEIPRFICDAFEIIIEKGLHLDGLFRKEGNSVRLNRADVQEVYRGARAIPADFTVYDICTMVKRFLRDLKPILLNSADFRVKLMEKARQARRLDQFEITHNEMVQLFTCDAIGSRQHLPPAHVGTLAYIMRCLSRVAKYADVHKMTVDNLSVVLVGSVFGDFMGGGTESRKKGFQGIKCTPEALRAKKEDMEIQVAAVKLLIINSNLIGLPKSHYVSSISVPQQYNYGRSTSAMPTMRCSSTSDPEPVFEVQSSSSNQNMLNMPKSSLPHRILTRRDSDLTHEKLSNKREPKSSGKRSSSSYSLLKGFKNRVSNQFLKRNKSPSPDRAKTHVLKSLPITSFFQSSSPSSPAPTIRNSCGGGGSVPVFSSPKSDVILDTISSDIDLPQSPTSRPIVKSRNRNTLSGSESKCGSIGSTSSARQSRSIHAKRGNTNSAKDMFNDSQLSLKTSPINNDCQEKSQKSSSETSTLTCRSLRRLSQSDQNSFEQRMLKRREKSEEEDRNDSTSSTTATTVTTLKGSGDATPPSLRKKKRIEAMLLKGKSLTRRNTVEGVTTSSTTSATLGKMRTTKRNQMEAQRRATCWDVGTIAEEKENARNSGIFEKENEDDLIENNESNMDSFDMSKTMMERMNNNFRLRRVGVHERRNNGKVSDSMTALNGSMAQFEQGTSPSSRNLKILIGGNEVKCRDRKKFEFASNHGDGEEETKKKRMGGVNVIGEWELSPLEKDEPILSPKFSRPTQLSPITTTSTLQPTSQPTMEEYMLAATSSAVQKTSATTTTPSTPTRRPFSAIPLKKLDSIGVNGLAWVGERQLVCSSPQPPRKEEIRALSAAPDTGRHRETSTSRLYRSSMRDLTEMALSPSSSSSPSPPSPSPVVRRVMQESNVKNLASSKTMSPLIVRSKSHLDEEKISKNYEAFATPPRNRKLISPMQPSTLLFSTPNTPLRVFSPMVSDQLSTASRPKLRSTSSLTSSAFGLMGSSRPISQQSSVGGFFTDLPSTPQLSRRQQPSPLVTTIKKPSTLTIKKDDEKSEEEEKRPIFKCPLLPPMKSHENDEKSAKGHRKTKSIDIGMNETKKTNKIAMATRHQSSSAVEGEDSSKLSDSEYEFGEYNEALKNAHEEMNLPTHKNVESRPSVAHIRNSNCGLVQSRINQFQGMEQKSRTSMDSSRTSAFSQASLKSTDTISSMEKA